MAALQRGLTFRRFPAHDIRSILGADVGVAEVVDEGQSVELDLPQVSVRELSDYALGEWA